MWMACMLWDDIWPAPSLLKQTILLALSLVPDNALSPVISLITSTVSLSHQWNYFISLLTGTVLPLSHPWNCFIGLVINSISLSLVFLKWNENFLCSRHCHMLYCSSGCYSSSTPSLECRYVVIKELYSSDMYMGLKFIYIHWGELCNLKNTWPEVHCSGRMLQSYGRMLQSYCRMLHNCNRMLQLWLLHRCDRMVHSWTEC